MYDAVIVGAGPSGSYTAGRLSQAGLDTLVIEEHCEIGQPVHCTGIVSDKFLREFSIPDELVQKRLSTFKILDPRGRVIECPPNIRANVIFRKRFDNYLAGMARTEGTRYLLSARVIEVTQDKGKVTISFLEGSLKKIVEARLCILATGSMSDLPYSCGIDRPRDFLVSMQADAEIDKLEGVELYLGNSFAPGSFAYAVAINGRRAKLGIIVKSDIRKNFENLLMSSFLNERIASLKNTHIHRRIPLGFPKNSVAGRIIAVGDAAGQLKTTTGGGIYFGLLCARVLSQIITTARTMGDFDLAMIGDYDKVWKRKIIKELRVGLLFRKFLETVTDDDLTRILDILKNRQLLEIVEMAADFDFHQKLIVSLLKVPELHKIVFRLVRKNLRIFA